MVGAVAVVGGGGFGWAGNRRTCDVEEGLVGEHALADSASEFLHLFLDVS